MCGNCGHELTAGRGVVRRWKNGKLGAPEHVTCESREQEQAVD